MARRILIAVHEGAIRQLVRRRLEDEGYEVAEARDGIEALEGTDRERFDMVVLADVLPRKSGPDVLRDLFANPDTQDIPVVMLASKTGDIEAIRAWQSGVSAYLTNPFNPRELVTIIQRIFERLDQGPP